MSACGVAFISQIDITQIREDIRVHCLSFAMCDISVQYGAPRRAHTDGNLTSCTTTTTTEAQCNAQQHIIISCQSEENYVTRAAK